MAQIRVSESEAATGGQIIWVYGLELQCSGEGRMLCSFSDTWTEEETWHQQLFFLSLFYYYFFFILRAVSILTITQLALFLTSMPTFVCSPKLLFASYCFLDNFWYLTTKHAKSSIDLCCKSSSSYLFHSSISWWGHCACLPFVKKINAGQ